MDSPEYKQMNFQEVRSKFFDLLSDSSNATTDWTLFKDLKQGPDESVEVFLIKVKRSFILVTRNNEPFRVHLNTEQSKVCVIRQCRERWWGSWILPSPLPRRR